MQLPRFPPPCKNGHRSWCRCPSTLAPATGVVGACWGRVDVGRDWRLLANREVVIFVQPSTSRKPLWERQGGATAVDGGVKQLTWMCVVKLQLTYGNPVRISRQGTNKGGLSLPSST
uniref:Uncharacterized protein n=1 Tax=Sphaerodactylus townsendi TaxID=933632 RepID=A0ACB8FCQ0_9SAUR